MLSEAERAELLTLKEKRDRLVTLETARGYRPNRDLQPHQMPPPWDNDWLGWVMRAGRGSGKTFAGMDWLNDQCWRNAGLRCRVIAPTFGDAVASCVEGIDGLLAASNYVAHWNPSAAGGAVVTYPNKSKVWMLGTNAPKDVDRLRALTNIDIDVFEEAFANPYFQEAFDQASMSRRRGSRRYVVTSTPRPHPMWKKWEADPRVVLTVATMFDNKRNDPDWVADQEAKYKGTRLYRQEILGEILDDVEGALWTMKDIERSLVPQPENFRRVAIGVDPPSGSGTCGIVVVGADLMNHLYVLEDLSVTDVLPNEWASVVVDAQRRWDALVVPEINQGGRMVTSVLHNVDAALPIDPVNAAKGKQTRAEPISLLWEAEMQSAHFIDNGDGHFSDDVAKLIDQLIGWVPPGEGRVTMASPDRLDAMVWACTKLRELGPGSGRITNPNTMGRSVPTRTYRDRR